MDEPVDWALAERIAVRVATRSTGSSVEQSGLQADLEHHALVAEPLVEACTGLRSVNGPARIEVVDRAGWARVNIAGFRQLLSPVTEHWAEKLAQGRSGAGARRAAVSVTRRVAAAELGTLLGWLSRRVLGQYDLLVAADGGHGDTVYIVGPNLIGLEQRFGFPPEQFRLWVVLHELTHRAQFTGVPWMRQHYLGLVNDVLSMADMDPAHLLGVLRSAVQDRAGTKAKLAEGGLAAVVASPQQRAALTRISGLMALLEGHGDVTMTRAGADHIPAAPRFERVLAARRQQANPLARTVQRLLGLEAKLNQYAAGERFIASVEAANGARAIDRCWESPDHLPTIDEIRDPDQWLTRMGVTAPVA